MTTHVASTRIGARLGIATVGATIAAGGNSEPLGRLDAGPPGGTPANTTSLVTRTQPPANPPKA